MKENRWKLIAGSLITLLPGFFTGKIRGSWISVLVLLAAHLLVNFLMWKDPKNKNQSKKAMEIALWIIPVISIVILITNYIIISEKNMNITVIMMFFLGFLFIVMGNYMPKFRQNSTMGIRVPWTLNNEENWNKTHRFSGRIWVFGGILVILAGLIENVSLMITVIILLAVIPIVYSYLLYRKQMAAGTYEKKAIGNPKTQKVMLVFIAVILVFVGVMLFTGKIDVQYGDDSFIMDATYYGELEVEYADIQDIEFREERVDGTRVSGFGSMQLALGHFQNDEFGIYYRYTYTKCDTTIVLTTESETIVINDKDEKTTRQMFEELKKRVSPFF